MLWLLSLLFLATGSLSGDWNDKYLDQSKQIASLIPHPDHRAFYEAKVAQFSMLKGHFLQDKEIRRLFAKGKKEERRVCPWNGVPFVLKWRVENIIHEAYTWDLSLLLGMPEYVVPSYPIESSDRRAVIQDFIVFPQVKVMASPPPELVAQVSLRDYWRAHLLAFLLGMNDLSGANIAVLEGGIPSFFDNESALYPFDPVKKNTLSFRLPYISVAFDWPQFNEPIPAALADEVESYLHTFIPRLPGLFEYGRIRHVQELVYRVVYRMRIALGWKIRPGMTFADLYRQIFPRMMEGYPEMRDFVFSCVGHPIGVGSTFFFTTKDARHFTFTPEQKEWLNSWIAKYIEN
jgi:hypothetical protein